MRVETKQIENAVSIIAEIVNPSIGSKIVQNKDRINPIVKNELEYFSKWKEFFLFLPVFFESIHLPQR